jgi:hypothetical protein
MADACEEVMPMLRELFESEAHLALGYPSYGAYIQDRFGGSLARLGIETRREVVRELTAAGMSTRDIAPVLGVSKDTVNRDQLAVSSETPEMIIGHDGKAYPRHAETGEVDLDAYMMRQFATTYPRELTQAHELVERLHGLLRQGLTKGFDLDQQELVKGYSPPLIMIEP